MKDEGEDTMNYQHYSPEFKAKVVLQMLYNVPVELDQQ